MKILYVTSGVNFELRKTSFELTTIKELMKRGHKISIISTDINPYTGAKNHKKEINKIESTKTFFQPIIIDEIPVYNLHCNLPMSLGGYCHDASKLARVIIEKFDIVHIASWYHYPAITFAKIAFEKKIPFLISAYAALQPENRNNRKIIKWFYDNMYTKKFIRKASGMHSVGSLETKAYAKLGAKPNNIFQINPAIATKYFIRKSNTKIFTKLGLDKKNDSYLLFLGRIVKRKRIELILNAFSKIHQKNKEIFLVIAGSGTKSYENELKQLTKILGIEKNVKFAGLVLGEEKLELLETAKILVHMPSGDIHPLAVEEALTMKVPVVTTDCDMPEIKEYYAGKIITPEINSLSKTILELLENKNELLVLSNNAKKLVDAEYVVEKQVKKYEYMYEKIIQSKK